jgi:sugar phosphate isomerase/epimerase
MNMIQSKIQVHIPYPILLEKFSEIREAGINPEIYLSGKSLDDISMGDVRWIKKGLDDKGLNITMHGPYMDLNPGGGDERVRRVTIERYLQFFQVADMLNPLVMVLHSGYDRWRYDSNESFWLKQSIKTWPQFVEKAGKIGATIAVENVFDDNPGTLKMLVETINSPNFKVCFDPGHWNLFSRFSMEDWFDKIGGYIAEVHIHDNHGARDDHLAIGDGQIDFNALFELSCNYSKEIILTIEAHNEEVMWKALKSLEQVLATVPSRLRANQSEPNCTQRHK